MMTAAFLRFLIALIALIAITIYSMTTLLPAGSSAGVWVTLFVVVPIVSYTWSAFARKCLTSEARAKSPFLYSVGMLFGVPQKVFGLICFLVGIVWIYSYMSGLVRLSMTTVTFSYGLLIFGLAWLMNVALSSRNKGQ